MKTEQTRQEPESTRAVRRTLETTDETRRQALLDLEPENGVFAWTPCYDYDAIVKLFPDEGQFEGNIYRPSAWEIMGTMITWTATIASDQLVMEKHLGGNATAVVCTGIRVGEIAGPTGSASIRVARRDEGTDGSVSYFENDRPWVTRVVPKECGTRTKAIRHLVKKIDRQIRGFTRPCPECAETGARNLQVLCSCGNGPGAGTWWRGLECPHSTS